MTYNQKQKQIRSSFRDSIAEQANDDAWFHIAQKTRKLLKVYAEICEGKNVVWNFVGAAGALGASVTQVKNEVGCSLPMASKILSDMRQLGLMRYEQKGRERIFFIDADACLQLEEFTDRAWRVIPKIDNSEEKDLNHMISILSVLTNEMNFVVWKLLFSPKGMTVTDVMKKTGAEQPVASTALAALLRVNIVARFTEGNFRRYASTFTNRAVFFQLITKKLAPKFFSSAV